jgi:hypothetical protein
MLGATISIGGLLVVLSDPVWLQRPHAATPAAEKTPPSVYLTDSETIFVADASPIQNQLASIPLQTTRIEDAQLTVSGVVIARVRPGKEAEPIEDRWQFSTFELANVYADWLRTKSELVFLERQLEKAKQLRETRVAYTKTTKERLEGLVETGATSEAAVRDARANHMRAQIEGDRDVFSAESALRTARKNFAAYERDLSQAGLEPVVFSRAVNDMVLVVAHVPESRILQVRDEQACRVRFLAYANRVFDAHVESLSSTISADRRTLRVLFELSDPKQELLPGMFAEVGLGTEARDAILLPAEGLLRLSDGDYALKRAGDREWRPVPVLVGEAHRGGYEVVQGLAAGDVVISQGAILLKPLVNLVLRKNRGLTSR